MPFLGTGRIPKWAASRYIAEDEVGIPPEVAAGMFPQLHSEPDWSTMDFGKAFSDKTNKKMLKFYQQALERGYDTKDLKTALNAPEFRNRHRMRYMLLDLYGRTSAKPAAKGGGKPKGPAPLRGNPKGLSSSAADMLRAWQAYHPGKKGYAGKRPGPG